MARRKRTWDEEDAFGPWNRYLCWPHRAGVKKHLKRATHKREPRDTHGGNDGR